MSESGPSVPVPVPLPLPNSTTIPSISTSTSNSTSLPASTPTIIEFIHHLLSSHTKSNLQLTHLHPYPPSSSFNGKGKGKIDEIDTIRSLKDSISRLRNVLSGMPDGDGEGRLIRGLKEISTHQSPLLQTLPTLSPYLTSSLPSSSSSSTTFPSSLLLLTPTKLLETISNLIGLQCFIEDSQFGLLKSSLAIAGTKFVIDVDLEIDQLDDGDDDMVGNGLLSTSNSLKGINGKSKDVIGNENGKIKLSKIILNHIKSNDETGKSEYITNILKLLIEDYLDCYNNPSGDIWEKQIVLDRLIDGLRELKVLDDYSTSNDTLETQINENGNGDGTGQKSKIDKDGFEEIEQLSQVVESLYSSESQSKIYPTKYKTVFPTFRLLLPSSSASSSLTNEWQDIYNLIIKIRPSNPGEQIPSPPLDDSNNGNPTSDGDVNMENNNNTDTRSKLDWAGRWIIEIQPEHNTGIDGLVVRRNWLNPTKEVESDTMNGIKVENLLYRPFPATPIPSLSQQAQLFPYTSTFSHQTPLSASAGSENANRGMEQKWSMVQPGPNAFVVGRMGLPKNLEGLGKLLNLIRNQIVLNNLFTSIFKSQNLISDIPIEGDDDDDGDIDDLLSGNQHSIPVNMETSQNSVIISFPLIKQDGAVENVEVIVEPDQIVKNGFVSVSANKEIIELGINEEGRKRNLVDIVNGVIEKRKL